MALAGQPQQPQQPLATEARRAARVPRTLFLALVALSAAPLGAGLWTALPAAQQSAAKQVLSRVGAQLSIVAGWYEPRMTSPATPGAIVAAPDATLPGMADPLRAAGIAQRTTLAYGDRLAVTFYESFGIALESRDAGRPVTTIYPRVDLSADYVIDEDGLVTIPRLGTFAVAGMGLGAAQSALQDAFHRVFGRSGDVRIAIQERQPIYLLGAVRAAGVFAYRPGMTVLQALATAGGTQGSTSDVSVSIEVVRETQLLHQAQTRRNRLLVARARLAALRYNVDTITPPPELTRLLAGKDVPGEVASLLTGAQASLRTERAQYQQQRALAERQAAIAAAELRAQALRILQLDLLVARKTKRLRELEGIAVSGSVPHFKLIDVAVDIAEVAARREDARVGVAQSERRVLEAEILLAKIDLEHSAGIDKARSEIEQEIEEAGPRIAAMQAVIRVLQTGTTEAARDPAAPLVFLVTRRTAGGSVVLAASELTELLPGDVIQVSSGGRVRAPQGWISNAVMP